MARFLSEMTWVAAGEAAQRGAVVLLPLSPTEAHGPHLPLGTDWMEATAIAVRAADVLAGRGVEAIIAPTIPHGVADAARDFPGNITIRPETLENLIIDVCASLMRHGFEKIGVVCMHMEPRNRSHVLKAIDKVREAHGGKVVEAFLGSQAIWMPKLGKIIGSDLGFDIHAGMVETSAILAIRPDLVQEVWQSLPAVAIDLSKELRAGVGFRQIEGGEQGYFGDPARSSAAKGQALIDLWGQSVAGVISELVNS